MTPSDHLQTVVRGDTSPIYSSGADYGDLASAEANFNPARFEEALAAFCARTLLLDTLGEGIHPVITGTPETRAALAALSASGLSCHPVDLAMFYSEVIDPASPTPHPDTLVEFTRKFAESSPSLRLGALVSGGISAHAAPYSCVHTEDLVPRLTEAWEQQLQLGLHLENMAALPLPYSIDRALRMLLVERTPQAAKLAPELARPHVQWCVQAYHRALGF